jgi:monoterpene epsilon-lactone hydrolase
VTGLSKQNEGIGIDADGTAHLGSWAVPVPKTISPEARAFLATPPFGDAPVPPDPVAMWEMRPQGDAMLSMMSDEAAKNYPVTIEEVTIGGVRTHWVRPQDRVEAGRAKLLINLHGGGFVMGSGSLIEAIPVASATGIPVVAVDYRLAPEHSFPAAVDDVLTVYRTLLETHEARDIGIYGSSAGAMLTAQAIVRFEREELPLPACLGMFTGSGDLADFGDSASIFTLQGFWGTRMLPTDHAMSEVRAYLGGHDPKDPAISPIHADLRNFPPSLMITGTRDALLSATVNFHRAIRRAGAQSDLFVFDAMPHAHWYALHLPETSEAIDFMAHFFSRHLSSKPV